MQVMQNKNKLLKQFYFKVFIGSIPFSFKVNNNRLKTMKLKLFVERKGKEETKYFRTTIVFIMKML